MNSGFVFRFGVYPLSDPLTTFFVLSFCGKRRKERPKYRVQSQKTYNRFSRKEIKTQYIRITHTVPPPPQQHTCQKKKKRSHM